MPMLDERLTMLLGALERGGATGIAAAVLSRIQSADDDRLGRDSDVADDVDLDPHRPRPGESDDERGRRYLLIANEVVDGILLREIDLVPAIAEQIAVLNDRAVDRDVGFAVKGVAVLIDREGAEGGLHVIGDERVMVLKKMRAAWRAAWGPAIEGTWRDLR